jgi:hypothetical protein
MKKLCSHKVSNIIAPSHKVSNIIAPWGNMVAFQGAIHKHI